VTGDWYRSPAARRVVVSRVASLHIAKGTGEPPYAPGMTGTREGLGFRIVARNVVVEPWEHRLRPDSTLG